MSKHNRNTARRNTRETLQKQLRRIIRLGLVLPTTNLVTADKPRPPAEKPTPIDTKVVELPAPKQTPINELLLPLYMQSLLDTGGITTVEQLAGLSEAELCDLRGIGTRRARQILSALKAWQDASASNAQVAKAA